MAKATVLNNPTYKLELTALEGEVLFRLIGNHVIGSGENRDALDRIFRALSEVVPGECTALPAVAPVSERNYDVVKLV